MALRKPTNPPGTLSADNRQDLFISGDVWKESQERARHDSVSFSDAVNLLIRKAGEGAIDVDPREDLGRRPGRSTRAVYPAPEDWTKFSTFAETKGLSPSRALELLLIRHKRGDFKMKAVIEFRETRGIKRGVTREKASENTSEANA